MANFWCIAHGLAHCFNSLQIPFHPWDRKNNVYYLEKKTGWPPTTHVAYFFDLGTLVGKIDLPPNYGSLTIPVTVSQSGQNVTCLKSWYWFSKANLYTLYSVEQSHYGSLHFSRSQKYAVKAFKPMKSIISFWKEFCKVTSFYFFASNGSNSRWTLNSFSSGSQSVPACPGLQ